jgi:hypothetical protein
MKNGNRKSVVVPSTWEIVLLWIVIIVVSWSLILGVIWFLFFR